MFGEITGKKCRAFAVVRGNCNSLGNHTSFQQCAPYTILSIWWRHQDSVLAQFSRTYTHPKILSQYFCLRLFGPLNPSFSQRGQTELPFKAIRNGVGWNALKKSAFKVKLWHLNWARKVSDATRQKEIWGREDFFSQKKILWYSLMIGRQTHQSRIQVHSGLVKVHGSWSATLSIALYHHCLLKGNCFCYSKGSILLFFSVGG